MTPEIKKLIHDAGAIICPACNGEGEIGVFCGHDTTSTCFMCAGKGIVKSLDKQQHRNPCAICRGGGGPGCCKNRGFHEWESYELWES